MTTDWITERGETSGLRYIEMALRGTPTDAPLVIGLHGRGGDAEELTEHAEAVHPDWRYVFPQAPHRLDMGAGKGSFSWYEPIMSPEARRNGPERGVPISPQLLAARAQLRQFLRATHERLGVPPSRSALLGFSQGAAMTLDTGLHTAQPYRTLVAICGYLPESDDAALRDAAARQQPVLVLNGTADDPLRFGMGRRAQRVLAASGLALDYREFPMGHEISAIALEAIATFLRRHLLSA